MFRVLGFRVQEFRVWGSGVQGLGRQRIQGILRGSASVAYKKLRLLRVHPRSYGAEVKEEANDQAPHQGE